MITGQFCNELSVSRFRYGNIYNYAISGRNINCINLPIYIEQDDDEVPLISLGEKCTRQLYYFAHPEFNNRQVTVGRLADILNSARVPLKLRFYGLNILAGKGYLSLDNEGTLTTLFMVNTYTGTAGEYIYYINRVLYTDPRFKKLLGIITGFLKDFTGDVVIARDIEKYVGHQLMYPHFSGLKARRDWENAMKEYLIQVVKDSYFEERGEPLPF